MVPKVFPFLYLKGLILHNKKLRLLNINNGAKSFVVYGEPQSGKTEFMIAMVCKLLDEGFETIFIIL